MDIWKILGISPSKDKKEITEAYHNKLLETNPEDKPEEFKQLRSAYEKALEYCNENTGEKTKIELWVDKLIALYDDFKKRVNVENWKELLDDDLCFNLDSKYQVESEMLHFFMNNYFLPHQLWILLNERFDFLNRVEELYENYPKDFIDYVVINGIIYDDTLPFELFDPCENEEDCHRYLDLYREIRNKNIEESKPLFEEIDKLSETHAYGTALRLSHSIAEGNKDKYQELIELCEKYPEDLIIVNYLANEYYYDKKFKEADELLTKTDEKKKLDVRNKWLLANSKAEQGNYSDAKDVLNDIFNMVNGDTNQMFKIDEKRKEWNEHLIEEYAKKYEENPNDDELKLDYAWALIQNNKNEEAIKIANEIKEENVKPYDYYNLLSNVDLYGGNVEKGLVEIDRFIEITKQLEDDGTEKTRKRINKLSKIISDKGYFLCTIDKQEEGLAAYREALEISNNKPEILTDYARMLAHYKKYREAEEYTKKLIQIVPNATHGYELLSSIELELNNDNEAFAAINKAIDLDGTNLDNYIQKFRILTRNRAEDAAKDLVKFLEDNNAGNFASVKFCKGYITEIYDGKKEEALEIYKEVEQAVNGGEYISIGDIFYYRYLNLMGEKLNGNNKEDVKVMMDLADKGLAYNDDHYGLMDYKAWLLKKDGKTDEALKLYQDIDKLFENDGYIKHQIGLIYYDDLKKNVETAHEYFLKAYELGNNDSLFYLGYCNFYMNNLEKSEEYYLKLREVDKEKGVIDVDSYYRIAEINMYRRDYEKALADNEIAIAHAKEGNYKLERYYKQRVQILRAMNKPIEAAEFAQSMINDLDLDSGYELMSNTYEQFGMFDKATEWIDKRLKRKIDVSKAEKDNINLMVRLGKIKTAKFRLFNTTNLQELEKLEVQQNIAFCDLKLEDCVKYDKKLLEYNEKHDYYTMFRTINLAENLLLLGDDSEAEKYANKALELYETERGKYNTEVSLYHIAKARIFTCLKKFEEAQKELDLARQTNCGNCHYCRCKDADTFEIYLRIAQKKYAEAKEMCNINKDKWPEDSSYDALVRYIDKKAK